MTPLLILLTLALAVLAGWLLFGAAARRRATLLADASLEADLRSSSAEEERQSWLAGWLARAGYRSPSAVSAFIGATVAAMATALLLIVIFTKLGVFQTMTESLLLIPGGVGETLAFVASWASYIIFVTFAAAPTLVVRAARRARVEAIEQDLAAALELLAMLAEAGLGFDAAIARIQESEHAGRPLSQEFRVYQRDVLGGIPRLESLRKLARRVEIPSVSIFTSALIQAEQVGASLAETLRTQADDLRDRRKMRAVLLAQALPVKLVFPLMFCFLPGIFYPTLGPVISQFVDVIDSVLRR